ncbi:MAG: hypothetical protein WBL50_26820 [Candidatus Acidiferrum sp.]
MRNFNRVVAVLVFCAWMAGASMAKTEVSQRSGGKLPDGSSVEIYTLIDGKV